MATLPLTMDTVTNTNCRFAAMASGLRHGRADASLLRPAASAQVASGSPTLPYRHVLLDPDCEVSRWWEQAAISPRLAEASPLFGLLTLEDPARWCCLRRNMRPQPPVLRSMQAAGVWDDALEALPPRSDG